MILLLKQEQLLLLLITDIFVIIFQQSKCTLRRQIIKSFLSILNFDFSDASFSNLLFLTVDQIVADVSNLIHAVRIDLNATQTTRNILWGTGFGGSIATFTKQKYPHLVDGVWSSSGIYERTLHTSGKQNKRKTSMKSKTNIIYIIYSSL